MKKKKLYLYINMSTITAIGLEAQIIIIFK